MARQITIEATTPGTRFFSMLGKVAAGGAAGGATGYMRERYGDLGRGINVLIGLGSAATQVMTDPHKHPLIAAASDATLQQVIASEVQPFAGELGKKHRQQAEAKEAALAEREAAAKRDGVENRAAGLELDDAPQKTNNAA